VTDYSLKTSKTRAKDAFGRPLDGEGLTTSGSPEPGKSSLRRAFDKLLRAFSGREESSW